MVLRSCVVVFAESRKVDDDDDVVMILSERKQINAQPDMA